MRRTGRDDQGIGAKVGPGKLVVVRHGSLPISSNVDVGIASRRRHRNRQTLGAINRQLKEGQPGAYGLLTEWYSVSQHRRARLNILQTQLNWRARTENTLKLHPVGMPDHQNWHHNGRLVASHAQGIVSIVHNNHAHSACVLHVLCFDGEVARAAAHERYARLHILGVCSA
eukprot:682745-Pleurochrysis_carterae.AAC.1